MADSPANGDEVRAMTIQKNIVSRRQFFKKALGYTAKHATDAISARANRMAPAKYLRPPGALPEPLFLLTCTRCEECVAACPHYAISMLPPEHKAAASTPVITPQRQPCMMCEDFPCISVCGPKAIVLNEKNKKPVIGSVKVDPSRCWSALGQDCNYCKDECLRHASAISLTHGSPPEINYDLCDGCGRCEYICPVPNKAAIVVVP